MESTNSIRPDTTARQAPRDRYVLFLSALLLMILAAAFTRSFYLGAVFDSPALPTTAVVHGIVLSLWFVWLFMQTTLIRNGRRDIHRRTGIAGAVLAGAVVVTGVAIILGVVPGMISRGESVDEHMQLLAGIFWGNGGILLAFVVFVLLAIRLRRYSAAHKRLMILASIAILPPALHRVGLLPFMQVLGSRDVNALVFTFVGLIGLLLSLVLYDIVSRRRLHPVTAWGVARYLAWFLVCIFVMPGTVLGRMSAEWLVRSGST